MVNSNTGVNFNIFTIPIRKYGSEVTITPRTQSDSNIEGDQTFTEASTTTAQAYIVRKNRGWFFDKAGTIEGGDAEMLALPTTTVSRYYKITWQGNTYMIRDVLDRDQLGGNIAYKRCNLFLL